MPRLPRRTAPAPKSDGLARELRNLVCEARLSAKSAAPATLDSSVSQIGRRSRELRNPFHAPHSATPSTSDRSVPQIGQLVREPCLRRPSGVVRMQRLPCTSDQNRTVWPEVLASQPCMRSPSEVPRVPRLPRRTVASQKSDGAARELRNPVCVALQAC